MDLKSFARRKNKSEPTREEPIDKQQLEKTVEELGKKSESELMSDLMREVQRGKSDGSFDDGALAEFMDKVSPMLTPEQQRRMQEITARLKM